ncbi:Snx29 [Phodopus roborovskii]|uniref:Snx29 protein n=1 Tax=Phodopus roborovskii TaxID=109678 RepID=A0AAU9Z233_PHORO|nr:Snx29 [Phodopus roborovskii]
MSMRSQNDDKRQFLLERLLDAVKQPVFWFYVKEVLNKHELQRFYSLHHISADVGRGRAWLRCALNEHSLERYLHTLLADRARLSTFYEDWSFVMDEERSSMLPTMAAGLNSILFAINIDNKDLNGQSKFAPTVSDLLKESTQNVTSLLKESTQGMSSLLREITASSAVSILIKPEQETDPLPVISKNVNVDARYKRERRRRKKVTNIVSFDDDDDEQNNGDTLKKMPGTVESSSINVMSTFESPFGPNSNGSQSSNSWKIDSASLNGELGYQKLDVKSIDDDVDENEEDVYGNSAGRKHMGHSESTDKPLDGKSCLPQVHGWAPLQVLHGDADADTDVLFPVSGVGSYVSADAPVGSLENGTGPEDHVLPEPGLRYSMEASSPGQGSPLSSLLPSASMPESMTVRKSLRNLLDGEMEHSASLRQEVDALKRKVTEQQERHTTKVQALASFFLIAVAKYLTEELWGTDVFVQNRNTGGSLKLHLNRASGKHVQRLCQALRVRLWCEVLCGTVMGGSDYHRLKLIYVLGPHLLAPSREDEELGYAPSIFLILVRPSQASSLPCGSSSFHAVHGHFTQLLFPLATFMESRGGGHGQTGGKSKAQHSLPYRTGGKLGVGRSYSVGWVAHSITLYSGKAVALIPDVSAGQALSTGSTSESCSHPPSGTPGRPLAFNESSKSHFLCEGSSSAFFHWSSENYRLCFLGEGRCISLVSILTLCHY